MLRASAETLWEHRSRPFGALSRLPSEAPSRLSPTTSLAVNLPWRSHITVSRLASLLCDQTPLVSVLAHTGARPLDAFLSSLVLRRPRAWISSGASPQTTAPLTGQTVCSCVWNDAVCHREVSVSSSNVTRNEGTVVECSVSNLTPKEVLHIRLSALSLDQILP